MRRYGRLLPAVLAAVALAGCGATSTKQPVSGTVTWKGQPLETGMIRFLPQDGPARTEAVAVITQGRYAVPGEHGLDPGTYKVSVSSPDPKSGVIPDAPPGERGGYPATERIPAKYNSQTQLTFEVRAGVPSTYDVAIE
jgi:hypothetical protein